jgi:hypothetical protein
MTNFVNTKRDFHSLSHLILVSSVFSELYTGWFFGMFYIVLFWSIFKQKLCFWTFFLTTFGSYFVHIKIRRCFKLSKFTRFFCTQKYIPKETWKKELSFYKVRLTYSQLTCLPYLPTSLRNFLFVLSSPFQLEFY